MTRQTPENVVKFLHDRGYTPDTIPTLRELQSMVGGSLATISKAVASYRADLKQSQQEPMSDAFRAIFTRAAEAAWSASVAEASKAAEEVRKDAESAAEDIRKECERLEGLNAELRAELAAVKTELQEARAAASEKTVRAKVADENAARLVEDIRRLREALSAAREERAEAIGALKALKESGGLKHDCRM